MGTKTRTPKSSKPKQPKKDPMDVDRKRKAKPEKKVKPKPDPMDVDRKRKVKPEKKVKPKPDPMDVDRKKPGPKPKDKSNVPARSKKQYVSKGRRSKIPDKDGSSDTRLIQAGKATVKNYDGPMVPFRNSGLITPPPLMQVPTNWTRMSQAGIQPAQFPNNPMEQGYFQKAELTESEKFHQGWAGIRQTKAHFDAMYRDAKERQKIAEMEERKQMEDLGMDPDNKLDVKRFRDSKMMSPEMAEEHERRLAAAREATDMPIVGGPEDLAQDVANIAIISAMNEDQKAAQPAVSSSSQTQMGPPLNPVQRSRLNFPPNTSLVQFEQQPMPPQYDQYQQQPMPPPYDENQQLAWGPYQPLVPYEAPQVFTDENQPVGSGGGSQIVIYDPRAEVNRNFWDRKKRKQG